MPAVTDSVIEFKIVCPFCGKTEIIKVPKSELENSPAGIYRVPVEHNEPEPHVLVLDLDPSGFVRGAYLIKKYISTDVDFSVRDSILSVGVDNFAYLLAWGLSGYRVILGATDIERKITRVLDALFEGKLERVIKVQIGNIPEPPYNVEILEKHIIRALKMLSSNKAILSYLKGEIDRYRRALSEIQRELDKRGRVSFKELKKLFGRALTEEELRFIISILISIEPKYKKMIDMPEVRIAELF